MIRFRRVLVVANPAAGVRAGRDAGAAAAAGARAEGAAVELVRTTAPGDARAIARRAASERFDLVLAAGGDGTVHEVANGLAGSATAVGVAPAGTMNLLARVLALPLDPGAAARTLVGRPRVLPVRPGRAGDRLFLLMAGAGFDAWVLERLLAGRPRKIRIRDYAAGAIGALRSFAYTEIAVEADGERFVAHTAIVGRAPLYGGFLRPTPGADLLAPRLDLCLLQGRGAALARVFPAMWSGAHDGAEGVIRRAAARIRLDAPAGEVPLQLDGELAGRLPVDIDLSDRVLRLAR